MGYQTRKTCMLCGATDFTPVIDLGSQFIVDFVKSVDYPSEKAPLYLRRCNSCHLVQLKDEVTPDRLYRKFWYRSGINESMRSSLRDVVTKAWSAVHCTQGDRVLDIGANDGTLLSMYPGKVGRIGVDPCDEVMEDGRKQGHFDASVTGYFNAGAVRHYGPFKIITAIAMFYDVPNPVQFLSDCKQVLDKDGVLVIQMNYLLTMLEDCAVDNICHEHLAYFSVTTFEEAAKRAGLEIQGTEINAVNGGSVRFYLTHPGGSLKGYSMDKQASLTAKTWELKLREQIAMLDTDGPYAMFRTRVASTCTAIRSYLENKTDVYVYGASTRGSTLMQCLDLPKGTVVAAAERDKTKFGLYTVGTLIPIKDEDACRKKAKVFLVLPWHFVEGIKRREEQWLSNGGKMLVPLPQPYVITHDNHEECHTPLTAEVLQ